MVNRIVVGAGYGLRDWLAQRVTGVVIAVYALFLVFFLIGFRPTEFGQWKMLFAQQWMKMFTFLFFMSLFYHAWVGIRDVIMDYVKPTGWRVALESAVVLALVAYAGWAVQIIWSI